MRDGRRRALILTRVCRVARVPATATDPNARETVIGSLTCSGLYPANREQAERAGMALATRLLVCYATTPDVGTIEPDYRLEVGEGDYRIRAISGWPQERPEFLELLIEDEQ